MTFTTLLYNVENGIAIITINRPDKMNALNKEVMQDLSAAMDAVAQDPSVKSVILTGAGEKAFVAGADISEFLSLDEAGGRMLAQHGQDTVFNKIENSSKPVVAAVNGFALGGGCELAMCCHFRLASENAKFGQPEVNLGLIPGYGGTQRLTQLIGKGKAMEWTMSGQLVDAQGALSAGLVNHVTTKETLLERTKEILNTINSKSPMAVGKVIQAINKAGSKEGYETEITEFGTCFGKPEMIEGVSAFMEKRKPNF